MASPGQEEKQQESCRSQTFGGRQDCLFPCPSLLLWPGNLGSPHWRCHGDAAGGHREDRQLEGSSQPAAPQTLGTVLGLFPEVWLRSRAHSTKSVPSLLAKATAHQPEGTCNFTSFGGEASKFNTGLPGLGSAYA